MPWKKGQSGNPAGRAKKGLCYADMLEKAVKKLKSQTKDKDGNVIAQYKGKMVVAMAVVDLATNKSYPPQVRLQALKELFDRTDGKPVQQIDMGADVRSTVIGMTKDIKASLDKLTPEEREMYFELCGKADDSDSEQ